MTRSSGSMTASLLGWIGGDERLELVTDWAPEISPVIRSGLGCRGGDGERRLHSTLRGSLCSFRLTGEREAGR